MADSRLSNSQQELGETILNALTNIVKMPVTSHEWKYVPQVDALDMAHISESTNFVRFEGPDLKTAQAGA